MNIELEKLNHQFAHKPLLIGGMAMEYYGLRKAGADVDLVVHPADHAALLKQYPDHVKDLYSFLYTREPLVRWKSASIFLSVASKASG